MMEVCDKENSDKVSGYSSLIKGSAVFIADLIFVSMLKIYTTQTLIIELQRFIEIVP